jgi:hypothetical protein
MIFIIVDFQTPIAAKHKSFAFSVIGFSRLKMPQNKKVLGSS